MWPVGISRINKSSLRLKLREEEYQLTRLVSDREYRNTLITEELPAIQKQTFDGAK